MDVRVVNPGDPCVCGHTRNHHNRFGLGRCLAAGCDCEQLTTTTTQERDTP